MSRRGRIELERRILVALRGQLRGSSTWTAWTRFLARQEAQRSGATARDAEEALRGLHERGYLALAFGFERGSLTESGVRVAERVAGRPPARLAAAR